MQRFRLDQRDLKGMMVKIDLIREKQLSSIKVDKSHVDLLVFYIILIIDEGIRDF